MLRTSVALGKDVADTLIRAAEQGEEAEGKRLTGNCDLIAMMTHGRGGLQRLSMGSVTEHVLGTAKLPLLVVYSVTTGGSNAAGRIFKQAQLTVWGDHMSDRPEKMPLIVNELLAANGRARHDARLLLRQSLRHGASGVYEHADKQPGDHEDYADQRDPHDGQGRGIEAGIRRDGGEGVPEA